MTSHNHADHFLQYFSVIPADTEELLQLVYKLRYDVYCSEYQYESSSNFPDGIEKDEYDQYAKHVLIMHKASGTAAGTTRLVLPSLLTNNMLLPLEKYCNDSLYHDYLDELNLPRSTICEASRLCVSKQFRRRSGESKSRFGDLEALDLSDAEQRTFPLISVSISLATTALTELTKHNQMFAMMEPYLPRLLRRIGYDFTQVGDEMDYHGTRAAYLVETGYVLRSLKPELQGLYGAIKDSLGNLAELAA